MKANDKHVWSRRLKFCVWGLTVLALGAACILFAKSRFESRAKRNVFPQELLAALGKGAEERCVTLVNGDVDKAKVKMDEVKSEEKVEAVKIRLPLPDSVKTTEESVREILRKAGKRIGRVHTNGIEKLTAPYKGDASTNGNEVEWRKALKSVLSSTGYDYVEKGDIVLFGRVDEVEIKRRYLPQECLLEQQECLSEQRQRQRECLENMLNNRPPISFPPFALHNDGPFGGVPLDEAIRYIAVEAKLSIPVDYFEPTIDLHGGKFRTRFGTNGQKIPWQVVLREVLAPFDYDFMVKDDRLVVASRFKLHQLECERYADSRPLPYYKCAQRDRALMAESKLKLAQKEQTKIAVPVLPVEARVAHPRTIKSAAPERRVAPPIPDRAKTVKPSKTVALKNDNAPRTIQVIGWEDDADAVTVGTADESGAESSADSISADEILNAAAEASGDPRVKFRLTHQMLEGMVIPPSSEIAETLEDAVRDILVQVGKQIGVVSTNGIEKLTMPYQQLGDGKSYECEWRKALRLLLSPVGYNFTEDGELVLFGLTDEVDYKHKHLAEERLSANHTPILFSANKSEGGMALRDAIRDVAVKANVAISTDYMEPADLYGQALECATDGMLTVRDIHWAKKWAMKLARQRVKVKYTTFGTNGHQIEWRKVLKGILNPYDYDFIEAGGVVRIAKKAKFAAWEEEDRKRKEWDRKRRENNFLWELGWSSHADPHEFAREVVQRDGGKSAGLRHNRDRLIRMRDEGDVRAGTLLGLHYFLGDDCVQHVCDQELAACYLEQTAEFGDVDAQWMIGLMCYRSDELKSFRFVKRVADAGNVAAQSLLGFMYGYGAGVVCNPELAIRYFTLAAESGDAEAKCQLGICHATGFGCPKDPSRAVELYRAAAERGDLTAQTLLAHAVYYGIGVKANREEGRALMEKVKLVGGVDALEFSDLYESERR